MRSIFGTVVLIAFALVVSGCDLDTEENFYFNALEITEAKVPENFVLNQTHSIDVSFKIPDNCTFFRGFDPNEEEAAVWNVVAVGSVQTKDNCTATNKVMSSALNITVLLEQPYKLRFYTGKDQDGNAQYLEYEIPVLKEN